MCLCVLIFNRETTIATHVHKKSYREGGETTQDYHTTKHNRPHQTARANQPLLPYKQQRVYQPRPETSLHKFHFFYLDNQIFYLYSPSHTMVKANSSKRAATSPGKLLLYFLLPTMLVSCCSFLVSRYSSFATLYGSVLRYNSSVNHSEYNT